MNALHDPWVRGDRLSPALQQDVLRQFVHRWTAENAQRVAPANRPLMPMVTDAQWLRMYYFRVTRAGKLDRRIRFCEPDYLHETAR